MTYPANSPHAAIKLASGTMFDGAVTARPRWRLLAVLFADVECFSSHLTIDERSTVAALDIGRQLFAEVVGSYDGRIVDTAGDSVLAVFETMLGALTAALEIQQRMDLAIVDHGGSRRMRFRIGIHMGDVLEKIDGSVYGLSVNIAARVQALAEPGGIAVSETICSCARSRGLGGFSDSGSHHLRNIDGSMRVYHLVNIHGPSLEHAAELLPGNWRGAPEPMDLGVGAR